MPSKRVATVPLIPHRRAKRNMNAVCRIIGAAARNDTSQKSTPPSTVSRHLVVPTRLDEICAKAMQKQPGERYQSMLEFVGDIRQFREEAMAAGTAK